MTVFPAMTQRLRWAASCVCAVLLFSGCTALRRPPRGIPFAGPPRPAGEVRFLRDVTWTDADGRRHCDQQIPDAVLDMVRNSQRVLLLDVFLFNSWVGRHGETAYRPLCAELTDALIERKERRPAPTMLLVTDPINTVYGAVDPPHLQRLRAAGIPVVLTNLDVLPDSNPAWSCWWRLLAAPFGVGPGRLAPNPFGPGRVSIRAWLRLLNFKANHRKIVAADPGGRLQGLVTSWNPHDGSSAHGNAAILFDGPAVLDLLQTERCVVAFSHAKWPCGFRTGRLSRAAGGEGCNGPGTGVTVAVRTESAIRDAAEEMLDAAGPGDRLDLVMFYFSHRTLVRKLIAAHRRGALVRVILDPNKDAFGHRKNGIPNRQTAWRLHRAGVPLRWYDTHGEQCHSKMLLLRQKNGQAKLLAGSANFTRRNLDDFNLETDVLVEGPAGAPVFRDAVAYVDAIWENRDGRHCTVPYAKYADHSVIRRLLASFMEWSGLSTF